MHKLCVSHSKLKNLWCDVTQIRPILLALYNLKNNLLDSQIDHHNRRPYFFYKWKSEFIVGTHIIYKNIKIALQFELLFRLQ